MHPDQLQIIDPNLTVDLGKQVDEHVKDIQYTDVATEEGIKSTIERIKRAVFIEKVTLSPPKIVADREESRSYGASYRYPIGTQGKVKIVTVEYDFSGSEELFQYRPNGGYSLSSNPVIYVPLGGSITVEVESENELNREDILQKADHSFSLTKQFIDSNNKRVDEFNAQVGQRIEVEVRKKANYLDNLYG